MHQNRHKAVANESSRVHFREISCRECPFLSAPNSGALSSPFLRMRNKCRGKTVETDRPNEGGLTSGVVLGVSGRRVCPPAESCRVSESDRRVPVLSRVPCMRLNRTKVVHAVLLAPVQYPRVGGGLNRGRHEHRYQKTSAVRQMGIFLCPLPSFLGAHPARCILLLHRSITKDAAAFCAPQPSAFQ